jgi:hypothetical protein
VHVTASRSRSGITAFDVGSVGGTGRTASPPPPDPFPLHGMLRSLILLSIGLLLPACGSTGTSEYSKADITGIPMTIKLIDYRSGLTVGLVNDSHSDRLAEYSEERNDAGIKVASDEIVATTIEYIEDQGYGKYAMRGLAPLRSTAYSKCLEIDDPQGVRYMAITDGSTDDEKIVMQNSLVQLMSVYNLVYGAQRVNNPSGAGLFYDNRDKLNQNNSGQKNR